jgi:hypothetical protein
MQLDKPTLLEIRRLASEKLNSREDLANKKLYGTLASAAGVLAAGLPNVVAEIPDIPDVPVAVSDPPEYLQSTVHAAVDEEVEVDEEVFEEDDEDEEEPEEAEEDAEV